MPSFTEVLQKDEKAIFSLRSLYRKYGYMPYKMSKFEEYDFYLRNKDFLLSDNIITFTDRNGKLMALKPDVTLSIVKNSKDLPNCVQKLCYNENVYRVSKGTNAFKEIMQVGLECLGRIDLHCIREVLFLAASSCELISRDFILDVSCLNILAAIFESAEIPAGIREEIMRCINEKNTHELKSICTANNIPSEVIDAFSNLISLYGTPAAVLPKLRSFASSFHAEALVEEFSDILSVFNQTSFADRIRIDFSVVNDMKYYNGIAFKGFINGIPESVLSGGQYDKLLAKMHRSSKAIGFAVYLDLLERLEDSGSIFDADNLLLYKEGTSVSVLESAIESLLAEGQTVDAQQSIPEKHTYRRILLLDEISGKPVPADASLTVKEANP